MNNPGKEFVILVDKKDSPTGIMEKMEVHRKGLLHRAFSIFIFNLKGELLLQRRALEKYHSPGLWTNTCCSHPRPGEDIEEAAHRRLKEEMGFDCQLNKSFSFIYRTDFENGLTEHEYDHVFRGTYDGEIELNPEEVCDYKFMDLPSIKLDLSRNGKAYSSWFKIAFEEIYKNHF